MIHGITRTITSNITYSDIVAVACLDLPLSEAANKLGVDRSGLRRRLKELGMCHWFPKRKTSGPKPKLKKDDLERLPRMNQIHAAVALGVHIETVERAIKRYGLRDKFPAYGGEAIWTAKKGYAI